MLAVVEVERRQLGEAIGERRCCCGHLDWPPLGYVLKTDKLSIGTQYPLTTISQKVRFSHMQEVGSPFSRLVEHIGQPIAEVAKQADISLASAYRLRDGRGAGAWIWRRLSARYGLEIRQLGLTAEDFLAGEILAGQPSAQRRSG